MIELFSSDTPNGKKISIMLEEIGFEYKVTKLDLAKGDQFKPEFKKISPFSKIPVIIDHSNNNQAVFESGAILIYLSERSGKFYDRENKLNIESNIKYIRNIAPHANPNKLLISHFEKNLNVGSEITNSLKKFPHTKSYDCSSNFAPVTLFNIKEMKNFS